MSKKMNNTYLDWLLMGYRVKPDADPVGTNEDLELLFDEKDVENLEACV